MIKLLVRFVLTTILLAIAALFVALLMVIDETPKLERSARLTPAQIERGKRIFEQNDPRRLKAGALASARFEQRDLSLALNYFVNQFYGGIADIAIEDGRARVDATFSLPGNSLQRFLNISVVLSQTDALPQVERLILGKLMLPGFIVDHGIKTLIASQLPAGQWAVIENMIDKVEFKPHRMAIAYRWKNDLPSRMSAMLFSEEDRLRIETYQQHLVQIASGTQNPVSLTALTRPLFRIARARSSSGEAIAENRALILVLAFYVNHRPLDKILASKSKQARPSWRIVTLNRRTDLTKHYTISAMLAAYAGTPLADAIGLYKEIDDSKGGSGFSFNDLAADRAGTRMGEIAVSNAARARRLQRFLETAAESDIMPKTADLPEFLAAAEFKRRFGGLHDARYLKLTAEIETRIEALPISRH